MCHVPMQQDKHYGPHCSTTLTLMQVVFLGNYVFWAWNLELKDNHYWIPEVVNGIILNTKRLRHTVQPSIPKQFLMS